MDGKKDAFYILTVLKDKTGHAWYFLNLITNIP